MTVDQFSLSCPYGCGGVLFAATRPSTMTSNAFAEALKADANSADPHSCECPVCGGEVRVEDDSVAVESGGSVQAKNISKPKIESIDIDTGPEEGGTEITITGQALDVGELTVRFGDTAAAVGERTPTTVDVTSPAGTGTVDVSVENEYGQRSGGASVLALAFDYEP